MHAFYGSKKTVDTFLSCWSYFLILSNGMLSGSLDDCRCTIDTQYCLATAWRMDTSGFGISPQKGRIMLRWSLPNLTRINWTPDLKGWSLLSKNLDQEPRVSSSMNSTSGPQALSQLKLLIEMVSSNLCVLNLPAFRSGCSESSLAAVQSSSMREVIGIGCNDCYNPQVCINGVILFVGNHLDLSSLPLLAHI